MNGNTSDTHGSGETDMSGHGFMFWNMYKSLGKPILCALVSGDAAATMDEEWVQDRDKACRKAVDNAIKALKRAFQVWFSLPSALVQAGCLRTSANRVYGPLLCDQGKAQVPPPTATACVSWKNEKYTRGAYSSVGIGGSGADYDELSGPVLDSCGKPRILFAGEHTCKEHPDTVGGAMLSGLREAVRILSLTAGHDPLSAAACANIAGPCTQTLSLQILHLIVTFFSRVLQAAWWKTSNSKKR